MSLDIMKQALEALNDCTYDEEGYCLNPDNVDAITALRAAIEQAQPDELMIWKSRAMSAERIIEKFMQPEQEPVFEIGFGWLDDATKYPRGTKLYTAPRQWQGLTEEELNQIYAEPQTHAGQYARAIEAKLKEKNT